MWEPDAEQTPPAAAGVTDFPRPRPGTMGPPPEYEVLRRGCPIARVRAPIDVPFSAWVVTRYEDVRALLADPRLIRPEVNDWPTERDGVRMTSLMELEGEEHSRLRRALGDEFSVRACRRREPAIRALAGHLLDDFAREQRPADLIGGFVDPFAFGVMAEVSGIPREDREHVTPMAREILLSSDLDSATITPALQRYVVGLIDRGVRDGVLGTLTRQWRAGELSREDVLVFGRSMVIAGFATTAMFLSNAFLLLLSRPEAGASLRADAAAVPAAVEELLRYLPVLNGNVLLVATEDISWRGTTIRAGEGVIPVIASADRDEAVFPEADRVDLTRDPNPHLAFGRGPHNCVGSHLARTSMVVALEAVLGRFPDLRLGVAEDQLPWSVEDNLKAPLALPVEW